MAGFKNIPIGKVLQEYGYVTEEQVQEALAYQKTHKELRLGEVLLELGYVNEHQVLDALGKKLMLEEVVLSDITVDSQAVHAIPEPLALKYNILGIKLDDNILTVAVNDPLNFYGLEDVRQTSGYELRLVLTEKEPLIRAIKYYYAELTTQKAAQKAVVTLDANRTAMFDDASLDDEEAPIVELLNSLVERAYQIQGSDIHIEPFEKETIVRMRVDGVITDYMHLQASLHNSLIARIKILGGLDIAERRVPQDGHFRTRMGNEDLNVRVSVLPTVYGEKAVLRLLSSNVTIVNRGSFGMNEDNFNRFSNILQMPNGIIYITGPTGSGKSTTLYMVLEELSRKQVNISTIEDPVEKTLPKINQSQVNNQAGMTFSIGLRALLRQDPDVIMIGETRDAETASISISAAITGHLVLSTLHTNSACSSVARLVDMGMEPYMVSSSVVGIMAQRLMRRLCPNCKQAVDMTDNEVRLVGGKFPIYKPVGCPQCNNTGYRGRIAIHEILTVDRQVKNLITKRASAEEIQDYAMNEQGMKTLKQQAAELVKEGITSMEELIKVAYTVD